jgi:hypothetical protein
MPDEKGLYYLISYHQIGPGASLRPDDQILEVGLTSKIDDDLAPIVADFATVVKEAVS